MNFVAVRFSQFTWIQPPIVECLFVPIAEKGIKSTKMNKTHLQTWVSWGTVCCDFQPAGPGIHSIYVYIYGLTDSHWGLWYKREVWKSWFTLHIIGRADVSGVCACGKTLTNIWVNRQGISYLLPQWHCITNNHKTSSNSKHWFLMCTWSQLDSSVNCSWLAHISRNQTINWFKVNLAGMTGAICLAPCISHLLAE